MRHVLALAVALLAVAPADAADGPTPADDQAMKLWQRSVLSAFQKARAHEADITKGETGDTPRFPDLDALMPPQETRSRLLSSHYADMNAVSECRQAVLQFRWLAGDREDVSSLYDPKIAQEVRDYVGSARRCESAAKLPAIGSRLREVADVIASTPAAPEKPPVSLGLQLPLRTLSSGKLVDVTLNEVFHQMLKDGIEARTVTVFAHPGEVGGLQSTAAFLARAYLGVCHLDMVRVLVLRDDLPDQLNHPGTWLDVNRIAGADYDPNKRVFSSTFDVEVAKSSDAVLPGPGDDRPGRGRRRRVARCRGEVQGRRGLEAPGREPDGDDRWE